MVSSSFCQITDVNRKSRLLYKKILNIRCFSSYPRVFLVSLRLQFTKVTVEEICKGPEEAVMTCKVLLEMWKDQEAAIPRFVFFDGDLFSLLDTLYFIPLVLFRCTDACRPSLRFRSHTYFIIVSPVENNFCKFFLFFS